MKSKKDIRYIVLLNSLRIEKWQFESLEILIKAGFSPQLIVLQGQKNNSLPPSFMNKITNYPWKNLLFRLYHRFFFKPNAKQLVDASKLVSDFEKKTFIPESKGISNHLKQEDLETIKALKPHFILRFGFGILKGEILDIPEYGVWSYHHGDEENYRGAPPGFWEIYNNENANASILQIISDKLDAGKIIQKSWFKTINHSWSFHLNRLLFETSKMPLQSCRDIVNGHFNETRSSSLGKIYKSPNNFQFLVFMLKIFINKIAFHYNRFFKAEDWKTYLLKTPVNTFVENPEKHLAESEIIEIPNKHKEHFYADPFIHKVDNRNILFMESYDYKKKYGHIAHYDTERKVFGVSLDSGKHLSYPGIYELNKELYCIPESFSSNGIELYKLNKETLKFNHYRTLLPDVAAVDPTMLYYNGKYWIFFTKQHLPSVHLYIYYADSPDSEFKPHANNPVKSDIRNARPGGAFIHKDGNIYRPVQNCEHHYGASMFIQKITELSTNSYKEELFKIINPNERFDYNQGIHTLNGNEEYTVIDGKKFCFKWANFFNQFTK